MNQVPERLEIAVNNIMSGNNACGTLAKAAQAGDREYFRAMLAPILATYDQEAVELRKQRDDALRDAEAKRFALEMVASNVDIDNPDVITAIKRALPGRMV